MVFPTSITRLYLGSLEFRWSPSRIIFVGGLISGPFLSDIERAIGYSPLAFQNSPDGPGLYRSELRTSSSGKPQKRQ